MYLDFDEYKPDIQPIGRAISWREGILLSIILHLVMVIVLLTVPSIVPRRSKRASPSNQAARTNRGCAAILLFVQPRVDLKALRPRDRGPASDMDRNARARERATKPNDPLPFSRGNTPGTGREPGNSRLRAERSAARAGGAARRRSNVRARRKPREPHRTSCLKGNRRWRSTRPQLPQNGLGVESRHRRQPRRSAQESATLRAT